MLAWLPLLLQIIGMLPGLIRGAELAFSGKPGSGQAKKDLVMDAVKVGTAVAQNLGTIDTTTGSLINTNVGQVVDSMVTTINAVAKGRDWAAVELTPAQQFALDHPPGS